MTPTTKSKLPLELRLELRSLRVSMEKQLQSEIERITGEAKAQVDSLVKKSGVFRDVSGAENSAKKVAQDEISAFKEEVSAEIEKIMENIRKELENHFDDAITKYLSETSNSINEKIDEFRGIIDDRTGQNEQKINDIVNETINTVSEKIKELEKAISSGFSDSEDSLEREVSAMKDFVKTLKGDKGDDGKDGSPDTALQIKDKLETLKGNDRLAISAIKNLTEELNALRRMKGKGGGGGGMGNIEHQRESVSSATTTVSLSYNVAAGSSAIWIYYQGQHLAKDTHYTISAKTITLLFTPDDDTYLNIVYVRTA